MSRKSIIHGAAILTVLLLSSVVLLTSGCGGKKKTEPVTVGELSEYRDAVVGFHLKYPKGWIRDAADGVRAKFFNAPDVDKRFLDPTGPFPDGVVVSLELVRTDSPDSLWRAQVEEMGKMGFQMDKAFPVTLAGKAGHQVNYTGAYTAQIRETGHHIYVTADTLLYDFRCAGFSDLYQAHKAVFDAVIASFEFPKPVEKGRDRTLPSDAVSDYATPFFSFQYPENFNFESAVKGSNDLALSLRGVNRSTSIQFSVFGAKNLTLERVVEQNKGKFPGAVVGKATVNGQPALTLTYSASRDVDRRFYFVVKNDKVIRVTLDWVKAQRAEYLAAYDKVVASIKLK